MGTDTGDNREHVQPLIMHPDFEEDLERLFAGRMRGDSDFCKQVWSSLANIIWRHESGEEFSASFRYAGGMIADILDDGDYMDWYCSGPYETVSDDIAEVLLSAGWTPHEYGDA